jgi:DNA-binding IclR family transcriptional regulator
MPTPNGASRSAELSRARRLSKSTTLRLLGALERERLVSRDGPRSDYRLGPGALELGARAQRAHSLPTVARAELEQLARVTKETASLEVLVGSEILILDEVMGPHLVSRSPSVGTRWPAHAASTGKVLLAAAREGNGEPWPGAPARSTMRFEAYTPRTITSAQRFDTELSRVLKQGYATAIGELELGYVAIGAPVRNHLGRVVAAVCLGGPSTRLTESRIASLAVRVRGTADRISRKLGDPGR